MSGMRLLFVFAFVIFGGIGFLSIFKGEKEEARFLENEIVLEPIEIVLMDEFVEEEQAPSLIKPRQTLRLEGDRMNDLFTKGSRKLPFVETITYKKRVPWLNGRPAWVADYASHYKTSRHFIARSLNGRADYENQNVRDGDRFNVLRTDMHFEFYLVVELESCKMWLYVYDLDRNERTLLKSYQVGVGRDDPYAESGSLTPLGKYRLGEKIAIYRPKMMGVHQGEKHEMIQTFGTRWIPFGEEVEGCTQPAQGFGIHGLAWKPDHLGRLVENKVSLGQFDSDGCIRLATEEMEELFAVIITRPSTIEIVKNLSQAKLPGRDVSE